MKTVRNTVLALAFAAVLPTLAHAQDNTRRDPVTTEDSRDHRDFGWIGLLGLVGLAGLKRRDREHDTLHDRDRVAVNR